jgi:hypothetical protein
MLQISNGNTSLTLQSNLQKSKHYHQIPKHSKLNQTKLKIQKEIKEEEEKRTTFAKLSMYLR